MPLERIINERVEYLLGKYQKAADDLAKASEVLSAAQRKYDEAKAYADELKTELLGKYGLAWAKKINNNDPFPSLDEMIVDNSSDINEQRALFNLPPLPESKIPGSSIFEDVEALINHQKQAKAQTSTAPRGRRRKNSNLPESTDVSKNSNIENTVTVPQNTTVPHDEELTTLLTPEPVTAPTTNTTEDMGPPPYWPDGNLLEPEITPGAFADPVPDIAESSSDESNVLSDEENNHIDTLLKLNPDNF